MECKHYYVIKDGHVLSDYNDYETAKKHCDLVDGEIAIEKC